MAELGYDPVRRKLLKGLGATIALAAGGSLLEILAACGREKPTPTPEPTPKPTIELTPEPTATPKPLADLAFGNVSYTAGEWGKDYKDGKRDYNVKFDVSNLGNIGSGAFYVSVSGLEQKLRFDNVEAGKSLPIAFDVRLLSGQQSIDLVIEPENKDKEKGGNNRYNLSIDVPEPPFKLVFDAGTSEQKETFHNNALEDYRTVLKVYGIDEKDVRMVITIDPKDYAGIGGFGVGFFYKGSAGGAGGPLYSLTTDRRQSRHEQAHAINHTLFSTKNNIEPWYNTFDEGSAKYASGEVENSKSGYMAFRKDDGTLEAYTGYNSIINYIVSNPNKFWERLVDSGGAPGHLTGLILYWLFEHEGLTPEKHTEALKILAETYKSPGTQTNKEMIQSAYEKAMGKDLSTLFDKWLEPGIKRFYARFYATPTPTR